MLLPLEGKVDSEGSSEDGRGETANQHGTLRRLKGTATPTPTPPPAEPPLPHVSGPGT